MTYFDIFWDYISLVWKQMLARKRRSWLTLLGVVIGITAIISLMLIGSGLENAINAQLDTLGGDVLFISPKGNSLTVGLLTDGKAITEDDEEVISKVRGISQTAGMVYTTGKVEFNERIRYFFVVGLTDDPEKRKLIGEGQNLKIGDGRAIEKGDHKKVVVGIDYTDENLFGQAAEVGDKIIIQDTEFKIVGIWERIGSSPDDRSVYMPLETYFEVFGNEGDLGIIMAEVDAGVDVNVAKDRVAEALRDYRGLEEGKEDFNIQTPQELAASFAAILGIVAAVLVGIATISLIVGGIGILNTMFSSVLQRTREIGILKAIGAKRQQILMLFLLESSLYGIVGGIIGASIGISFAKLVELAFAKFVGGNLFIVEVDFLFVMIVLIGSGIYGGICGIVPARRAAKADAVNSLRYE